MVWGPLPYRFAVFSQLRKSAVHRRRRLEKRPTFTVRADAHEQDKTNFTNKRGNNLPCLAGKLASSCMASREGWATTSTSFVPSWRSENRVASPWRTAIAWCPILPAAFSSRPGPSTPPAPDAGGTVRSAARSRRGVPRRVVGRHVGSLPRSERNSAKWPVSPPGRVAWPPTAGRCRAIPTGSAGACARRPGTTPAGRARPVP